MNMTSSTSTTGASKGSSSSYGSFVAKQPLRPRLSVQRDAIFNLLKQLSVENEHYFRQCTSSTYNTRIANICEEISTSLDLIKDMIVRIHIVSHKCDYDENTPGNGFRSLICISDVVLLRLVSILRICSENRFTMMFRLSHYCKELESFGAILRFLILTFQQMILMVDSLEEGALFPPLNEDYQKYSVLLKSIESLDATCFYGRPIGFQFCPSVTRIFRVIGLVLATYSLSWETTKTSWSSLLNSGKLLLNPEQRAKRIIKVIREADIGFCRGFWNLSELPNAKLFCPSMAVCDSREIPLVGALKLETNNGEFVTINEPSSHTGPRPVSIKILSYSHRVGMTPYNLTTNLPPSPFIVVHCHGGGYVATSSKSHETYLRFWAKSLNCPLVSIDYSLAPENPFPRPTEEVIYTYAYIVNNPEKFGWTGEKICLVGDSAGGNLITSVCIRLIEMNVKRMPDGVVPIYTPYLFQYLPSPSRVLSFMNPLLHMGVVIRCAAAYTGLYSDEELDKNCSFHKASTDTTSNGHRSLADYVDQVQRVHRGSILDLTQGSQSIVSLINLSFINESNTKHQETKEKPSAASTITQMEEVIGEENNENITHEERKENGHTTDTDNEFNDQNGKRELQENLMDEDDENDTVEDVQTVRVDGDPSHICLSATNFDHTLIEYLQMHPLTRNSLLPIDNEGEKNNSVFPPVVNFDSEDVFEEPTQTSTENVTNATLVGNGTNTSNESSNSSGGKSSKSVVTIAVDEAVVINYEEQSEDSILVDDEHSGLMNADDTLPKTPHGADPDSSAGRTPFIKSGGSNNFLTPDSSIRVEPLPVPEKLLSLSTIRKHHFLQSIADTAALAAGHAFDNISEWFDTPTKEPVGYSDKQKLSRAATMSTQKAAKLHQEESKNHESHFTKLLQLNLPREYLMSPMYASDELLRKLPPMRFVACHLDPLLDDTIMFAKKLRKAGGNVVSIDLLDSLPHGFLNFAPMSYECREGANLCLERIKESLGMM